MRICIFGAGAVGGQLGARLSLAGIRASLIARGPHLVAMRERGLTLVEGGRQWTCRPTCVADAAELGEQDIVVVTVKTTSLAAVAAGIGPLLGAGTQVVFAMNGVPWWFADGLPCDSSRELRESLDPDDALRSAVGIGRTVGCSINAGSEVVAPGIVRSDTPERNRITLGKPDGTGTETLREFAALAARAGFPTAITARIRDEMWPKLMTHACRPPICALADITTRELAADADLLLLVAQVLRELVALGNRLGLSFQFDLDAEIARKPKGDHLSSFVQDMKAGRRPELASGILAMRSLARAAGVATPMLDGLSALISARVSALLRPG